ncbi:MAG: glycine cleavage system aminomethyltransferase GcvT [Bacillota bacterium]
MKKTTLHDDHVRLGAKMVEFAGYEMPLQYTSIKEEHEAVRKRAGVFDVSHMGEIYVFGKNATAFVDSVFTNNVSNLNPGEIAYGFLCYEDGGTIDDLLAYKYNESFYLLVVNAANKDKDFKWLNEKRNGKITVVDKSDLYGQIALQGPDSESILNPLCDQDLGEVKPFTFVECLINELEFLVSRTGYTGEDGFEIYGEPEDIKALFNDLVEKGVTPAGLGARDTLRYEAALPLYGHELSSTITPVDAGMTFAIDFDKDAFIGKDALLDNKKHKKRRLVGLELLKKNVPREGYEVYKDDALVGHITTGYISPTKGAPLAMALIDKPHDKRGTELTVAIRNKSIPARVIKKKLLNYKPNKT